LAFRAEAVIQARMEKIHSILSDTEAYTQWMPDCIVSRILTKDSQLHELAYSETSVPVANNRDAVVETRIILSSDTIIHLFKAVDRRDLVPEIKGKIRIRDMDGKWELRRNNGMTRVIYEVRADPGGNIPAWLANSAGRDVPHKTIIALMRMAAPEK